MKCTAKDRATILVSSLYNLLVFRLKRLFFFEVDVEVNQDIPIGTTFAMSLECDWTEDISYSESKPKPGQPLEVARMFICLLSMLKDDVVLEAEVIKVSEYLNI